MTVKSAFPSTLDAATLGTAFHLLGETIGGGDWRVTWGDSAARSVQRRWLSWFEANKPAVERLKDIKAKISVSADVLNEFLEENGFEPLFKEIENGVGVAAIMDMLVKWAVPGTLVDMPVSLPVGGRPEPRYVRSFKMPKRGFELYMPDGYDLLVRLHAEDGSSAWVAMMDQPADQLALVETASKLLDRRSGELDYRFTDVVVPVVEFEETMSLDWLLGLGRGAHQIQQAFQVVKWRLDEEGARVEAATGLATERGMRIEEPLRIDRPFLLFLTQPGSNIPVGVTYVTPDRWTLTDGARGRK